MCLCVVCLVVFLFSVLRVQVLPSDPNLGVLSGLHLGDNPYISRL